MNWRSTLTEYRANLEDSDTIYKRDTCPLYQPPRLTKSHSSPLILTHRDYRLRYYTNSDFC